ncbi:Uu.00g146470.m01.CDS01 [Anthostomella pinea]|uniref:Uu.00g146470.m01.CDS01 n=1 Tax=Anthostomella pinea TaxID=933095 RepID=A0AAI8VRB1_9PEZI|nr:Uu.00g146470.m01.CDS01 [Anthostomella pinea]
MPKPDSARLLALAGLCRRLVLQRFFKEWLKINLTTLALALSIFGAASAGIGQIQDLGRRIWNSIAKFFVSSISVSGDDKLNQEIIHWLGHHVLPRQELRSLTAQTESLSYYGSYQILAMRELGGDHRKDREPIHYMPSFGITWFFHGGNLFMVRRLDGDGTSKAPHAFKGAPKETEHLVVMCLGRSVAPIKRFFDTCQQFVDSQRESFVKVRVPNPSSYNPKWRGVLLRPIWPLETVHFDPAVKEELVEDIARYCNEETRRYYRLRGIPYRRGYLLHGPPGTGKTSLSLALAGHFELDLYLLHLPTVSGDDNLGILFQRLPDRCMVVIEDIDAVGIKRKPGEKKEYQYGCTLSGLLNVLDGVASSEGRVVFMTSNHPENLDEALIRPGRIDRIIYMGKIGQPSAKEMFLRMYASDEKDKAPVPGLEKERLEFLLQGYLLGHRDAPGVAAEGIAEWAVREQEREEQQRKEEEKAKAKAELEAEEKEAEKEKKKAYKKSEEDADKGGSRCCCVCPCFALRAKLHPEETSATKRESIRAVDEDNTTADAETQEPKDNTEARTGEPEANDSTEEKPAEPEEVVEVAIPSDA